MVDDSEVQGSSFGQGVKIFAAGTGMVFCVGALVGVLVAYAERERALDLLAMGILAGIAAVVIGLAFIMARLIRQYRSGAEPMSDREKMNQKIIWGCGAIGGIVGIILSSNAIEQGNIMGVFSNGPLPPSLVVPLAIFWGAIMPFISVFWHRKVIDEQEAAAYRDGALIAVYAFWYGAPVWWLLWRGGLAPEPHGPAIYMITIFAALIVWSWKKYR